MLNDYRQIISAIKNTPWLIMPESLETILEIVNARLSGKAFTDEEIKIRLQETEKEKQDNPRVNIGGGVGVLSLVGPIFPKANLMTELSGATSLESFRQDLRGLLADDSVKQIVLDVDSPGGSADLIHETGKEIRDARDVKPIYAVANTLAASGALWLSSQATKFYSTESGKVGSLGVYHVHEDRSRLDESEGTKVTFVYAGKFKTAGNPHEPLSEEAKEYIQEHVDEIYDSFITEVAVGRGMDESVVRRDFGEGKLFSAKMAKKVGMIDDIASIEDVLGDLVSTNYQSRSTNEHGALAHAVKSIHIHHGGELLEDSTEFSEPGDVRPHPELNPDENVDKGWRRDTPPPGEDGSVPNRSATVTDPNKVMSGGEEVEFSDERLAELRELLGLGEDDELNEDTVVSHIQNLNAELKPLQRVREEVESKKKFAVEYPDEAKMLAELQEQKRESFVSTFTDSFEKRRIVKKVGDGDDVRDEPTSLGFSALVLDNIRACAQDFTEGSPSIESVKNILDAIMMNGLVDYGNKGSDRVPEPREDEPTPSAGTKNARDKFFTKVKEIAEKDEVPFETAVELAATQFPELAMAYRAAPVAPGTEN